MRAVHADVSPAAAQKIATFHNDTIQAVIDAVKAHDVVVIGMTVNPHVGRARRALAAAGVEHHYLEFGGYHNQWKRRLAIKMWSGWPTFPVVIAKGQLIGGADETEAALAGGAISGAGKPATATAG